MAGRSGRPLRRAVGAAGSGPDGLVEVGGGVRGAVADAGDRGPDGPGDVEPGPFGFRAELPRPAVEPGRGSELADQEVLLGAEPAGPLGVVPLLRLGEFLVEVGQALPVGGPGLPVEDVTGGGAGGIVQAVGVRPRAGQAWAGPAAAASRTSSTAASSRPGLRTSRSMYRRPRLSGTRVRASAKPTSQKSSSRSRVSALPGRSGWSCWPRTASSLVMPQSVAMVRASASAAAAAGRSSGPARCRSSSAYSRRVCASMGRAPSRRWQPMAAR